VSSRYDRTPAASGFLHSGRAGGRRQGRHRHNRQRAVLRGQRRTRLSVLFHACATAGRKDAVGRGRPFVGGQANAFNFSHFSGSEAYASFPSGHATTAFALAFAVSALWPHLRVVMLIYAVTIGATRLVLLAHHPSDVIAGALLGVIGAMLVRYWFAARHLAFTIRRDGAIEPLAGPSLGHLKRVARNPFAP